jgi:hypothetical protein
MALSSTLLPTIYAQITLSNIFLAGIGYVLFCAIYQIVHYRLFHPLSKYPGPFWASVTRLWIAYHNFMEDEYVVEHELHKKYGAHLFVRSWAITAD